MKTTFADQKIHALELIINHTFKNKHLALEAICHKSYIFDGNNHPVKDYERLEFLGDAVLGMIISEELMKKFPEYREGELSIIKSTLIRKDTLAMISGNIGLGKHLLLSRGEESSGGRERSSTLANTFESVLGAIYLDRGLRASRKFILACFKDLLLRIPEEVHHKEYKNLLQELAHIKFKSKPRYQIIHEEGPDHQKIFETLVMIKGEIYGKGKGNSKKEAEKMAAKEGYNKIIKDEDALNNCK
ncbi:MAG: ribonuclease III [Chlamydiota bacterium]|nr:ribonuclease III [Chlamydiota bacterium]